MAKLGAVAVLAFHHVVFDDDAGADAGAEREEDKAAGIAGRPGPVLAVGGGVGVVLERRRQPERLADVIADRHVLPRLQVRRIEDEPGRDVHRAGGGDADGVDVLHLPSASRDGLADRFAHPFEAELLPAMRLGGKADGAERIAVIVDDAGLHGGSADVEPDEQRNALLAHLASPYGPADRLEGGSGRLVSSSGRRCSMMGPLPGQHRFCRRMGLRPVPCGNGRGC